MRAQRRILAGLIAAAALAAPSAVQAQASETAVKAAFLPRFARYVVWPPAAMPKLGEPLSLCVIGTDPFGAALDEAARTQSVDGRRIAVRRFATADSALNCHIAFIQGSSTHPVGQQIAAFGRRPVVTVTDARNGGARGIVHFSNVSGRVRFFIDDAGAAQRGLTISSRLLSLAVGVKR